MTPAHRLIVLLLAWGLPAGPPARAEGVLQAKRPPLHLARCADNGGLSVVRAWQRAEAGELGRVRVQGSVAASVPCIDSIDHRSHCLGDMTLAGGYVEGTYVTLALRGDIRGVKLECTSDGEKNTCPVPVGTAVIATGRLDQGEYGGWVIRVESLCRAR